MGASFSLPKQWINGETLTHTDLNTQFNTILDNVAVASGIASLDSSTLVVQDPVNATATKTAGKICKWGTSEAFQCSALTATTIAGTTVTGSGAVQGTQLISTIATGTAPLTVTSTTAVANLTATNANNISDGSEYRAASSTAGANTVPVSGSDNFLATGWGVREDRLNNTTLDTLKSGADAGTYYTVGPTGAGADITWADLDSVPAGARYVTMLFGVIATANAAGNQTLASLHYNDASNYRYGYLQTITSSAGQGSFSYAEFTIPLDANKIFKLYYSGVATYSFAYGQATGYIK